MHAVVENVEGEGSGNDTICNGLGEDEMSEFGEWRLEDEKESGRHDQSQSVHGQVMVDTVQEEVKHHGPVGIGEIVVDVEEETVQGVFQDGPNDIADEEASDGRGESRCCRDG